MEKVTEWTAGWLWAGPKQCEVLHSLPHPWNRYSFCLPSHTGSCPRTQPWDSKVLLRSFRWYTWLSPVKTSVYSFKILVGGGHRSPCLVTVQGKAHFQVLCLLKLPSTNLLLSASFLWPLLASVDGVHFQISPGETLKVANQQVMSLISLPLPPAWRCLF